MPFLLLEGETQIALIPQTAGLASSSHTIAPLSNLSSDARHLFDTSLCNTMFPNWMEVEGEEELSFFNCLSSSGGAMSLNASLIGSATKHPLIR